MMETASMHVTRNVPVLDPSARAGDTIGTLQGSHYDSVSHVVVCRGETFCGIVRLEDLLAAPPDARLSELMDRDAPVVMPGIDQEVAARNATRHQQSALAVVDEHGRFQGLIPAHCLLRVLFDEHDEDLSRLGGFLHTAESALNSSQESVHRRFMHRIPWLLVGLAGAFAAADFVAAFEARLQEKVMLAFFIPGIVYLADAVGTQTETVVVRGLSVGVGIRSVLRREILTGLLIGLALALVALPVVWWRWEDGMMALGVSLSLLAACSSATLAAMLLPWLLNRAGSDPAFGSGPLATVVQDLLSIVLYFWIVSVVVF